MQNTKISYGLRNKKTLELIHIHSESNDSRDFCGETTVTLSIDKYDPLYTVDTLEEASKVLYLNMAWYNSSTERPNWGDVDVSELDIVKIETVTTVELVEPIKYVKFDYTFVFDVNKNTLKKYFPDIDYEKNMIIAYGHSVDTGVVGRVIVSPYESRIILAEGTVSEKDKESFELKDNARMFLCKTIR